MLKQADLGERLEKEWFSNLYSYHIKYPQEATEFQILLSGGLLPGWENSLLVIEPLLGLTRLFGCFTVWVYPLNQRVLMSATVFIIYFKYCIEGCTPIYLD